MHKISYLIALYNKIDYIENSIKSIINDISVDLEIEICVVDDGSTDGSFEKVNEISKNISIIKLHKFKENKGKVAAYNFAYGMSTGDYIAILGADDEIIKGRSLILLTESLRSNKSVYGGLLRRIDGAIGDCIILPPIKPDFYLNLIGNTLSGGALLMRHQDAKLVFPVPENLKFEDWWFSFHLLQHSVVSTIQTPVTIYHIHSNNDNGVAVTTLISLRRDYARHFDYLRAFQPYLKDEKSHLFFTRSLAIRNTLFGAASIKYLFKPPYDKSWLLLCVNTIIGIDNIFRMKKFILSVKKLLSI